MFIDHAAIVFFYSLYSSKISKDIILLYDVLRGIGRLAFPLFILFLTEGFFCTHSKKNYLIRLIIFAFISEIPFNLCVGHSLWCLQKQNIMLELLFGFTMIWIIDKFFNKPKDIPVATGISLIIGLISEFLHFDYGFFGIIALFSIYILKKFTKLPNYIVIIAPITMLIIMATNEWPAVFLIPVLYILSKINLKTEIKNSKITKIIKYSFYPAHLLLLYIIAKICI